MEEYNYLNYNHTDKKNIFYNFKISLEPSTRFQYSETSSPYIGQTTPL